MTAPAPLDCLTVVHLMWDFLDHELSGERWEEVRVHLATCTGCRAHVEFCRSFLTRLRDVPIDAHEIEDLRGRVRQALRMEGAGGR